MVGFVHRRPSEAERGPHVAKITEISGMLVDSVSPLVSGRRSCGIISVSWFPGDTFPVVDSAGIHSVSGFRLARRLN